MSANSPRLAVWMLWVAAALSACSPKITAPPEPPSSVRRGDDAFRYQQYALAIDSYREYVDQTEHGAYTASVMYKTALAEYRLARYRATLSTLDELAERYPKGHWVQVEALRGDAERALGNTLAALQDWEKAWKLASDKDRQKLRKRIVSAAQDLSDVELARARRLTTDQGFGALIDRQISARQPPELSEPVPNAGDDSTLEAADTQGRKAPVLTEEPTEPVTTVPPREVMLPPKAPASAGVEAEPLPPPSDTAWAAPAPAAPTPAPAPIEKTVAAGEAQIGCLLPLSGAARSLGDRAMRGVRLVFGADDKRLVVADTESNPAVAVRQFEQLARDPRVLAVIGPLRGEDAEAVARRAEELQVPVLLLSPRDGSNGQFVLQVGVTHAEQISGLLDYAMGKIRLRRFGILYPKQAADDASAFRSQVEQRGGTIVGAVAYPPGTRNLMSDAATVRKWHDRENLQAVFLPDGAAVAGPFATFLQREMPDVTLVGTQGWEVLADPHHRLNGVLFTDGFYTDSQRLGTRAFVKRFQQAYNKAPGLIEADAYDAATLAERALAKGAGSPANFLKAFRTLGSVNGATGDVAVTAQGLQRNVFLLQLSDGRLEEIGELPSAIAQQGAGGSLPPVPRTAPATLMPAAPRLSARGAPQPDEPVDAVANTPPPRAETVAHVAPIAASPSIDGATSTAKVACLLPLTGPDHAYGKRALAGLRLAFADVPEQLVVRDTGGDPVATADWLTKLKDDPQVVAVVGPLRSSEADAAAPIAERQRLPLLLLSQREGLAGPYVMQVAMTRTQQARLLVHYAVSALRLRRFGVVYPDDLYGSSFAATFRKQVAEQGATIVGTHAYAPGTPSFASALTAVSGWQRDGLDALFIPDGASTATALATDVRREMPSLVLLGTESWNDAKTLSDAGTAIDGVVFADAFFAGSARPSTREFVEQFRQRAGQAPTVFEAQAFDAGMALRRVIAGGATTREQIVAALSALGTFQGAGELRAVPGGLERSVSLLRYHDGRVEEVSAGAAES
jgi:ABC-type branched-subunit amino acid transport system substrate-binding protein